MPAGEMFAPFEEQRGEGSKKTDISLSMVDSKRDYLAIVKWYADAMIKDGRDTYGPEHSPLFASALDRQTMRMGLFEDIPGVRAGDHALGGANPQVDVELYAILYRLTLLTG